MARLIYIFALLLALPINAQQRKSLPDEMLLLNCNATGLLAGETLYFKLSSLDPIDKTPGTISKIAYVELIDSNRKVVGRQKILLNNSVGNGDFFIPTTLASGHYKLTAFTRYALDISATNYTAVDLTIVNTFQKLDSQNMTSTDNRKIRKTAPSNASFTATTDRKNYATREKVAVKINPRGAMKGHYSVSVKKIGDFGNPELDISFFEPIHFKVPDDALPEMRGELITGRITSDKKKVSNKHVALSIPGKSFGFKIVETDKNGRFIFVLDETPLHEKAVIQVMGNDRQDYTVLIDAEKRPDYSSLTFDALYLDEAAKQAIAERSIALQVENAYFDRKKDSVFTSPEAEPFYHTLETRYVLDDYNRFPTLRETIIEVVKEMYFTKRRDKYEIHLRNMTMNNEQFGQPLVLVDGLLIQEHDELFSYGAKYIEKVDVINEPYLLGPKTFSGLASISTKLQDFKSKSSGSYLQQLALERPQPVKNYFTPDYSKGKTRIPDYRRQLLWMPEISGNPQDIVFYTSDVLGTFEIRIQGFTETGMPVVLTETFEVR